MRQLLRYSWYACNEDEKRVDLYINGTRVPGCVHTDALYKQMILIAILVPYVIIANQLADTSLLVCAFF